MKRIIALCCLFMATRVLAAPFAFSATDFVSLILNGVRFSFSDLVPTEIVVTATGYGKTQEESVNNALVIAVQKGIGVLVVSDATTDGDRVVKDLAATYSSGVVNSFEIKSCESNSCTIVAKVSPWKFQRKLEGESSVIKVNGNDLVAQFTTMQNALRQRVKLTHYYFSEIQKSGLEVKAKSVKLVPSLSNSATLVLDYEVRMNPEFKRNFISFLEKLEKDTNGRNEENYRIYIQWGPTGLFENRVYINAYDANFRAMMNHYLSSPISVGVKELGVCERFDAPGGNIMTVDWYGFRKQKTISIPANKLNKLDNITLSTGCQA